MEDVQDVGVDVQGTRSENQHRMHMQNLEEEAMISRKKHEAQMQRLEEERKAEMDRLEAGSRTGLCTE